MYTKFYNLKEKPFNLTPDPNFLFLGETHREALAHLFYAVKERKGFMVMTGEVGTGKTTLIHALLRKLDADTKTVFIFNPILDSKDFFKFFCFDLGIQAREQTKGECLLDIYRFLVESYKKHSTVVLIIDEAHNLNPALLEEIRLLSNFETAKDKLIQIILVGQPELNVTLNLPEFRQLKQRISLWCYINPLNQKEMDAYIESRLRKAGVEKSFFAPDAIDEIYRYSRGIPRLINIVCDNALLIGYAIGQKKIKRKIIREAINDLDSGQRWFPQEVESPAMQSAQKPEESQLEEPEKERPKRGTLSLPLRLYVLLSRIYLLFFGSRRNKGGVLNHGQRQ
jgi:general secretion pathway protein A